MVHLPRGPSARLASPFAPSPSPFPELSPLRSPRAASGRRRAHAALSLISFASLLGLLVLGLAIGHIAL